MKNLISILAIPALAAAVMASPKVMIHEVTNEHCPNTADSSCVNSHDNLVIHYSLANEKIKKHYVSLFVSRDSGVTYNEVEVKSVGGDVGVVDTGTERTLVWDPGQDMPAGMYSSMRVKIMADEYVPAISRLYMTNMKVRTEKPSKVHFRFALRDQCNHAVVVPPSVLQNTLRVYENGQEIDYTESGLFVHGACRNRLKVALVLDFTQSMASIHAIDTMVAAAKRLINQLADQHSVALVAYHDRNADPVALLPAATSDKHALIAALDRYAASGFVPGGTRAWDAIMLGLDLLGSMATFDTVKVLVALTDGLDNASLATPDQIRTKAVMANAQVNIISFGDTANDLEISRLAAGTGGAIYNSTVAGDIEDAFEIINHDLAGQYIVTYVSQRRFDTDVAVNIVPSVNGKTATYTHRVNFASIYDDDRVGRLFAYRSVTTADGVFLNVEASHIPRAVSRMRFRIDTDLPYSIRVPWEGQGGVMQGWTVSEPDVDGYRTISSTTPADFADFGFLFNIVFAQLPAPGFVIPFEIDNAQYSSGYGFQYPTALMLGDTVVPPGMSICSAPVVSVDEPASLCATFDDPDNVSSWEWDFNGDGVWDTMVQGNCPRVLAIEYLYKESGDYRALLRIKHRYAGYIVDTIPLSVSPDSCPGCQMYLSKLALIPAAGDTVIMDCAPVVLKKNFYMGTTEVSQAEYAALMRVYPWVVPTGADAYGISETRPAWNVTWYDAALFCNVRSKLEGLDTVYCYTAVRGTPGLNCMLTGVVVNYGKNGYRLPTEAEWQYAYGALCTQTTQCGCDQTAEVSWQCIPYFWGNTAADADVSPYAWYQDNSDGIGSGPYEASLPGPQPVGVKLPNRFGLYDMAGNVWEWCGEAAPVCACAIPAPAETAARGGSWMDVPEQLTRDSRALFAATTHTCRLGFRVVRLAM